MAINCSNNFQELDNDDEETVKRQWESAVRQNPKLYEGVVCNFRHFRETRRLLTMHANKINYSFYFVKQCGLDLHDKKIINPITVGSITITSDNKIIMGRRKKDLVAGRKLTPLPQGFVFYKKGIIKPELTVMDRLVFELDIRNCEIQHIKPLGFVYDRIYGHTMIIYATRVSLSSDDVLHRSTSADGKYLASQVFFVKQNNEELIEFLSDNSAKMTGDCIGSFLLYGKDDFAKSFLLSSKRSKGR